MDKRRQEDAKFSSHLIRAKSDSGDVTELQVLVVDHEVVLYNKQHIFKGHLAVVSLWDALSIRVGPDLVDRIFEMSPE